MTFYQGGPVGVRLSYLAATAILVVFIVSVGANVANVNAGRPHPLQTGGPGGCIEGQQSVQQWCPGQEYKRWKRAKVCLNGQMEQETQNCGCSANGQFYEDKDIGEVLEMCPDGKTEKSYNVCECDWNTYACEWVTKGPYNCPTEVIVRCSIEGEISPTDWCEDGTVEQQLRCINGLWESEKIKTCPTLEEERAKLPKECAENEVRCIQTCLGQPMGFGNGCRHLLKCLNGAWMETYERDPSNPYDECVCFIATATYGSEWSPEVQLLRNFRDRDVLRTFAGGEGMKVFNLIYYSFSPQVAQTIKANDNLRTVMRYLLYPLIGILWTAQQIFTALAFSPEGAVVVAGFFTGSMIGLLYTLPFYGVALLVWRVFRRRLTLKHVSASLVVLAAAVTLIVVSELTMSALLMQVSTSVMALTAAALPGIAFAAWALNRHRPVAG